MEIKNRVAVVTGAASGIGSAVASELAWRGAKAIALVDISDRLAEIADQIRAKHPAAAVECFRGNVTDDVFRSQVFSAVDKKHGLVSICIPAAGITRDSLAVKMNKATGRSEMYSVDLFRMV